MKFTAALWDQDRAQLIFQTNLVDPTTEQPHCMAMTGVGNLEHAQTVVEEFRAFSPNLKLEIEQSRFGLLKSNGSFGGSGFSPMEEAAEARRHAAAVTGHPEGCECVACGMVPLASKKLNIKVKPKSKNSDPHNEWERPYTRHYGDLDPADSFEPGD